LPDALFRQELLCKLSALEFVGIGAIAKRIAGFVDTEFCVAVLHRRTPPSSLHNKGGLPGSIENAATLSPVELIIESSLRIIVIGGIVLLSPAIMALIARCPRPWDAALNDPWPIASIGLSARAPSSPVRGGQPSIIEFAIRSWPSFERTGDLLV
jgi:hypothetical protein